MSFNRSEATPGKPTTTQASPERHTNNAEQTFADFLDALQHPNADLLFEPVAGNAANSADEMGIKIIVVDTANNDATLASFQVYQSSVSHKRLRGTFSVRWKSLEETENRLFRQMSAEFQIFHHKGVGSGNPRELLRSWRELGQQSQALLLIALDTVDMLFAEDNNEPK